MLHRRPPSVVFAVAPEREMIGDMLPQETSACQYADFASMSHIVLTGLKFRGMKSIQDVSYRLLISMLKEARKRQKLTQAEMTERISSDQTYVSKVKTSERRIDVIELRTMCKVLNIRFP